MSLIQDIVKFGLGQFGIQATGDTPSAIAKSAITSFLTQKVNKAIKKSNAPAPQAQIQSSPATAASTVAQEQTIETIERQVKVEMKADTNASIPVVYGEAWVKPLLVDAALSADGCSMYYAVALCEATGPDLNGDPSVITIEEILWNNKKLTFFTDGNTVAAAWEGIGAYAKDDLSVSGNVRIYCYNNGSESPCNVRPQGLAVNHGPAYNYMRNWDTTKQMTGLVCAIIRVDYDAEQEVKGIGNLEFKVRNTLKKPGDVLNDYMTNTVYGGGIPTAEID